MLLVLDIKILILNFFWSKLLKMFKEIENITFPAFDEQLSILINIKSILFDHQKNISRNWSRSQTHFFTKHHHHRHQTHAHTPPRQYTSDSYCASLSSRIYNSVIWLPFYPNGFVLPSLWHDRNNDDNSDDDSEWWFSTTRSRRMSFAFVTWRKEREKKRREREVMTRVRLCRGDFQAAV